MRVSLPLLRIIFKILKTKNKCLEDHFYYIYIDNDKGIELMYFFFFFNNDKFQI